MLHQEGMGSSSPFAKKNGSMTPVEKQSSIVKWSQVDPSLRNEVAKQELQNKLKSRSSKQSMNRLLDDNLDGASMMSKASQDIDDDEEEYGDVYGWKFDGGAEGDRENDKHLAYDASGPGLKSYDSGYSLTSMTSSFSKSSTRDRSPSPHHPTSPSASSSSGNLKDRSLYAVKSLSSMTMNAAAGLVQSFQNMGEPEPATLIARSESFMKLHSLKSNSPTSRAQRGNDEGKPLEKTKSFVSSIDSAISTLGTKKQQSQVPPIRELSTIRRDDVFPSGAHVIKFTPDQLAPSDEEYKSLFDVKDVQSFLNENRQHQVGSRIHILDPLNHVPSRSQSTDSFAPRSPSPARHGPMKGGFMRPPPLDLDITAGGSAVKNQSPSQRTPVKSPYERMPPPMSPLTRGSAPFFSSHSSPTANSPTTPMSNGGRIPTTFQQHQQQRDGSASPLASASSSFLSQALKKTSSYLSIPLPTLALIPGKQDSQSSPSLLRSASSFLSSRPSPVVTSTSGSGTTDPSPLTSLQNSPKEKKEKSAALSERHKKVIADASPGVGTPVIYVPHTARSDATENTIYSNITSMTGMLEVGSPKMNRFKPSSLKHLDLSQVAEAPQSRKDALIKEQPLYDVRDVGPSNPIKELDQTWSACWDDEAGAIYYYNKQTGEATWLPPRLDHLDEEVLDEDFFKILNNGLPKGLSEFNLGDSELTLKTRKIAARHKLWTKLRNRYEGDAETEFSSQLKEKEKALYSKLEASEVLWEYEKEIADWIID